MSSRARIASLRWLVLALPALSFTRPLAAHVGWPWISIEAPPNPYDQETRGALLVVRVYHHGNAAYYPLTGTAEGLVNGQRQSIPIQLAATSKPGVHAVRFQKPAEGKWILVFRLGGDQDHGTASAVVTLGSDGQVSSIRVPTRQDGDHVIPQAISSAEIDEMLEQG